MAYPTRKNKNWWCRHFGHRPWSQACWHGMGYEYFRIRTVEVDNIGRQHAWLYAECSRCEEEFHIGKVHLPKQEQDAK